MTLDFFRNAVIHEDTCRPREASYLNNVMGVGLGSLPATQHHLILPGEGPSTRLGGEQELVREVLMGVLQRDWWDQEIKVPVNSYARNV